MQQLNPSEISDIIKGRIQGLDVTAEAQNEGTIVGVSDGIVRIHGLADAQYGEMIEFDGGLYGICLLYTSPSPRDRSSSRMPSSA